MSATLAERADALMRDARTLQALAARVEAEAAALRAEALAAGPQEQAEAGRLRTLTVAEAAQELGVGEQTLRESIRRGQVRHIRMGRRIVIPRHHVEELLRAEGGGRA